MTLINDLPNGWQGGTQSYQRRDRAERWGYWLTASDGTGTFVSAYRFHSEAGALRAMRSDAATVKALSLHQLATLPLPATKQEAVSFLDACLATLGAGFHPDTRGADYEQHRDGFYLGRTFTDPEAVMFDTRMANVFQLLDDPYLTTMRLGRSQNLS